MNYIFSKKIDWLILVIVAIIFVVSLISLRPSPSKGSPLSLKDQKGIYFVSEGGKEELIFIPLEEPWVVRTEYTKSVRDYVFQKLTKGSKLKKIGKWFGVIGAPITFAAKFIPPADPYFTAPIKTIFFCVGFGISMTGGALQFVGKDKIPKLEPVFLEILEVGVGKGEGHALPPKDYQTLFALGAEPLTIGGFILRYEEKIIGIDPEHITIIEIDRELMSREIGEPGIGEEVQGVKRLRIKEEGSQGELVVTFNGVKYKNRFILIKSM